MGLGGWVGSCNLSNAPLTVSTPEKKSFKEVLKLTLNFVALDVGLTTKIIKPCIYNV